jgi:hypothetical protein
MNGDERHPEPVAQGQRQYRPEVLEALAGHGFRPSANVDPQFVRDALSELYRYEIRRLRGELLRGAFPKREYADRVDKLRRRYVLLKLPVRLWTVEAPAEGGA